ncbi:MAG: hypothetical protein ACI4LS_07745 [Treponema sp.]
MKRFFSALFFTFIVTALFFAKTSDNERIQFAMLMNQVQYTTSTIIENKDKETLTNEFDFVINQIDKSKLYDFAIKNTYSNLLTTLKDLKLSENEREFVIEMNERERKQAYTQAFTSFGSVFTGGFSPASLISSIAYAGISAGLNIMSAKYQADNKLAEKLFQIEQDQLDHIDSLRIDLWNNWTDVINNYSIPISYEISETQMRDLVKKIAENKDNPQNLIRILESKKNIFEYFPVFWYQLGAQYQITKNYDKANECYDKFEDLTLKHSYLKTDPYYICVARNRIELLRETGITKNASLIQRYLKIIEKNIIPENGSYNRVYLARIYYELGQNEKAKELLRLNIARTEYYATSTELLALIEYEENKKSNALNPGLLLELNCINLELISSDTIRVSIPKKFGEGKFVIISYGDKKYPFPYQLESSKDVCILENSIDIDKKKPLEVTVTIIDRNCNTTKLVYDCNFISNNDKITKLLSDVSISVNDLDACLLKGVFTRLSNFSYNAEEDPEYIKLVNDHKSNTTKQTSKDKKAVWKEEEDKKLKYLEVNGRLAAITNEISEETKKLYSYPYFCSKASLDKKNNILTYSLKSVEYFSDKYTFPQYGLGTISHINNSSSISYAISSLIEKASKADSVAQYDLAKRYRTGYEVSKDPFNSVIYLFIAAMNNNADAQFDLGTIYSNNSSNISKVYTSDGISFVDLLPSVFQYGKEVFQRNYNIDHEKIAFYWFNRSANNGNGNAIYEVAKRYDEGLGVEKNADLAQTYYKKAYITYGILEAQKKIK